MAWFKVDDGFWSHPKVLELSTAAVALWVRAGSWCSEHLTDGRVSRAALFMLRADIDAATELVNAGLWEIDGDGWLFHDWSRYQPSRDEVIERRSVRAEAGRLGGLRSGEVRRSKAASKPEASAEAKTKHLLEAKMNPDPTRPVNSSTSVTHVGVGVQGVARKRATRIPEPFMVTSEMWAWAAEHTPDVDAHRSTERFVDYWRGKSGKDATKRDWTATWRNWLRSDQERAEKAPVRRESAQDRARARTEQNLALVDSFKREALG